MGAPAAATAGGFQFITSINTITRDDETRRKVRSHARRQKLPTQPNATATAAPAATQRERVGKFRVGHGGGTTNSVATNTCASRTANARKKRAAPPSSLEVVKVSGPARSTTKSHSPSPTTAYSSDSSTDDEFESGMITHDLAFTTIGVTKELPNFSALSIKTTPMTEALLRYMMTVCLSPKEVSVKKWFNRAGAPTYMTTHHKGFLAHGFAINPTGNLISGISIDNAATHSFMALIAAMHNSLANWSDTSTLDFHRFQTVKAVNARLNVEGKDSTCPVSDGVLVAVAMLVTVEAYIGCLDSAAAHMKGLKRMIDLRGGVSEGLWYSAVLQRSIAWADFAYGTAANEPLVLPFIPSLAGSLSLHDRFTSRSMKTNMEPAIYGDLVILNRDIIEVLELLHSVSFFINGYDYNDLDSSVDERVQVSDSIYLSEWKLCQLEDTLRSKYFTLREPSNSPSSYSNEATSPHEAKYPATDLSDALIYGTHLFLHLAIRGQPPTAYRHAMLTEALVSSLYGPLMALDLLSWPGSVSYGSPASGTSGSYNERPGSGRSSLDGQPSPTSTDTDYSSDYKAQMSSPTSASTPKARDPLHGDILLWILFTGSCVRTPATPYNSPNVYPGVHQGNAREYFVSALESYCRRLNITERRVLLERLKGVVWLNSWCDFQLDELWRELGPRLQTPIRNTWGSG